MHSVIQDAPVCGTMLFRYYFPDCDSHAPDDWVTSENIGSFENCTVIRGSLRILQVSFDG